MWAGLETDVAGLRPLRRVLLRGINGHAAGGRVRRCGKDVGLPASWPLLPLRDGRGFAGSLCSCRSLFALLLAKGEEGTSMGGRSGVGV